MRNKKIAASVIAVGLCLTILTGCGNDKKQQNTYRQDGINLMAEEKYEDAVNAFQKALDESNGEISDDELDICFLKAKAQYLSGDTDGALETYNAVIAYNSCPEAYYFRGNMYYAMNEEDKALSDYDKAIELDTKDYDIYIGVYNSLVAHGQQNKANEYLNNALKIEGNKPEDFMDKGRIYYSLGDEKQALEYLTKADEEGAKEASFYLAMIYTKKEDAATAQKYLDQFMDSGMADSNRLCQMGMSSMDTGMYEQAVLYFESALKLKDGGNTQLIMKNLIIAYEKSGDYDSAKELMDSYLKDYPEDDAASKEAIFLQTR